MVTAELTGHCLFVSGLAIAVVVLYIMWQDQKAEPIIQTPATSASVEKPKESSQAPESSTQSSTPPSSQANQRKQLWLW